MEEKLAALWNIHSMAACSEDLKSGVMEKTPTVPM